METKRLSLVVMKCKPSFHGCKDRGIENEKGKKKRKLRREIRHITSFLPVHRVKHSEAEKESKEAAAFQSLEQFFQSHSLSQGGREWSDLDAVLFSSSTTLSETVSP